MKTAMMYDSWAKAVVMAELPVAINLIGRNHGNRYTFLGEYTVVAKEA